MLLNVTHRLPDPAFEWHRHATAANPPILLLPATVDKHYHALVLKRPGNDEALEELLLAALVVGQSHVGAVRAEPAGGGDDHLYALEEEGAEGLRPGQVPACAEGSERVSVEDEGSERPAELTDQHAHAPVLCVEDLVLLFTLCEVLLLGMPDERGMSVPRLGQGAERAERDSPQVSLLVPTHDLTSLGNVMRHVPQHILAILVFLPTALDDGSRDNVDRVLHGEEAERLEPMLRRARGSGLSRVIVMGWLGEVPVLLLGDNALRGRELGVSAERGSARLRSCYVLR